MGERTYEVKVVGIDYICDNCNTGVMEATGKMLMVDPPQWEHKCNHCSATRNFPQKYPAIGYKRLPSD